MSSSFWFQIFLSDRTVHIYWIHKILNDSVEYSFPLYINKERNLLECEDSFQTLSKQFGSNAGSTQVMLNKVFCFICVCLFNYYCCLAGGLWLPMDLPWLCLRSIFVRTFTTCCLVFILLYIIYLTLVVTPIICTPCTTHVVYVVNLRLFNAIFCKRFEDYFEGLITGQEKSYVFVAGYWLCWVSLGVSNLILPVGIVVI